MKQTLPIIGALALGLTTSAQADQVFIEETIISANLLCVGTDCVDGEADIPGRDGIKIKDQAPSILFEDTSTPGAGAQVRDWRLSANADGLGDEDAFYIEDATEGTTPFTILGGAPDLSFFMNRLGSVGIGTSLPESPLHILRMTSGTGITMESTDISGGGGSKWTMNVGNFGFAVNDAAIGSLPFGIRNDAPDYSLVIDETGQVGVGTLFPSAPFDLATDEAFNFFRITATGAAVNDSVDFVFTAGPLGTGQLRYNIVDGDNQEMSLDADGNMVLDGTLTTTGPTCAGGCDRVFDADYDRLSLAEYQAAMWAAGHLPGVGPTVPNAPVNLTEKMGGMLNELEHAHIYIGELHGRIEKQDQVIDMLLSRLEALEAR